MKSLLCAVSILLLVLGMTTSAFAAEWKVEFEFGNPGRRPSAQTVRGYIMGCVPFGGRGSFVPVPPPPRDAEGPYKLTTPNKVSENRVYQSLMNCQLKPDSVTGIAITDED